VLRREKTPKKPVTVDESGWQEVTPDSVTASKNKRDLVAPEVRADTMEGDTMECMAE